MAKRGEGVRVLSAFFAGVLLAGTCARVASGPSVESPASVSEPVPTIGDTVSVDEQRRVNEAHERAVAGARRYQLQPGEPPLVVARPVVVEPSPFERRVLAWARTRCSMPEEEEGGYRFSVRDPLEFEGATFAIVQTPCLVMESGAYNYLELVIVVSGGGIRAARFAPRPSWAANRYLATERPGVVWNPSLEIRDGVLHLHSALLSRGLGDGGVEARFAWRGREFELVEIRRREESGVIPEEIGPFPIVAPPARRCSAELEVEEGRRAVLVLRAAERSRRLSFTLADDGCQPQYGSALICGGPEYDPDVGYGLTAAGADCVVVRVEGDEEREVFRTPRGCAL